MKTYHEISTWWIELNFRNCAVLHCGNEQNAYKHVLKYTWDSKVAAVRFLHVFVFPFKLINLARHFELESNWTQTRLSNYKSKFGLCKTTITTNASIWHIKSDCHQMCRVRVNFTTCECVGLWAWFSKCKVRQLLQSNAQNQCNRRDAKFRRSRSCCKANLIDAIEMKSEFFQLLRNVADAESCLMSKVFYRCFVPGDVTQSMSANESTKFNFNNNRNREILKPTAMVHVQAHIIAVLWHRMLDCICAISKKKKNESYFGCEEVDCTAAFWHWQMQKTYQNLTTNKVY